MNNEPGNAILAAHTGDTMSASKSAPMRPLPARPIAWSAPDLIKLAKEHPPEPIFENVLFKSDTLLIHGSEENYKSFFVVQMGESLALGTPLLRTWETMGTRRVGIVETEMHPAMMGERLKVMYPKEDAPEGLLFMPEDQLKQWRRMDLDGKFQTIERWISEVGIQVLMVDTANDFFRGDDNPSEEGTVGTFFDRMRNLSLDARILVRHDRKRREADDSLHSNERIRGSSEWKEDPEAIASLVRMDRRTHEVELEIGKLRYARKPDPMRLWFDAGCFRLTPLPPIIAVLEDGPQMRQDLVNVCSSRFGLSERSVDTGLVEQGAYLTQARDGHKRVIELDLERALEAPWHRYLADRKRAG